MRKRINPPVPKTAWGKESIRMTHAEFAIQSHQSPKNNFLIKTGVHLRKISVQVRDQYFRVLATAEPSECESVALACINELAVEQ
ncbi:hypothetical protein SAMN06264365_1363 [Actinoplanes regularis]|uniref:Uncharacterized protein n=1 Tax=Actinoplanes regularis TaxID=52697 RepID=A0A239JKZ3_9ACTN|nr:hypothetical protein SAMN06264365_1363 [Actinoplanes regularis]